MVAAGSAGKKICPYLSAGRAGAVYIGKAFINALMDIYGKYSISQHATREGRLSMDSQDEKPTSDNQQPSPSPGASENGQPAVPRRPKSTLLPQISDLALEGHSCREIGRRLGIPRSTVNRWISELQRQGRNQVVDTSQMTATAVARYDMIFREAMQAWRGSKADKEVRFLEDTEAEGNGSKRKRSVRLERRAGEITFLALARGAVDAICKLVPPNRLDQLMRKKADDMSLEEIKEFGDLLHENIERDKAEKAAEEASRRKRLEPPKSEQG